MRRPMMARGSRMRARLRSQSLDTTPFAVSLPFSSVLMTPSVVCAARSITPVTGWVARPITPLPTPRTNPAKPSFLAPSTGRRKTPVTPRKRPCASASPPSSRPSATLSMSTAWRARLRSRMYSLSMLRLARRLLTTCMEEATLPSSTPTFLVRIRIAWRVTCWVRFFTSAATSLLWRPVKRCSCMRRMSTGNSTPSTRLSPATTASLDASHPGRFCGVVLIVTLACARSMRRLSSRSAGSTAGGALPALASTLSCSNPISATQSMRRHTRRSCTRMRLSGDSAARTKGISVTPGTIACETSVMATALPLPDGCAKSTGKGVPTRQLSICATLAERPRWVVAPHVTMPAFSCTRPRNAISSGVLSIRLKPSPCKASRASKKPLPRAPCCEAPLVVTEGSSPTEAAATASLGM
mmetsp:Transcript_8924/g.27715  ORF Transcript_8924/g.27715 Transcript_8924/m.27715 type:complete len:412 (-) Transcript_8924:785-2020(-)